MKRCKCGEWTASSQNGICDLCCAKERTAYEQKKIAEAVAVARAGALEEAAARSPRWMRKSFPDSIRHWMRVARRYNRRPEGSSS